VSVCVYVKGVDEMSEKTIYELNYPELVYMGVGVGSRELGSGRLFNIVCVCVSSGG